MYNKILHYESLHQVCEHLHTEIDCDFVGFAFQNEKGPDIQWHIAAGNLNDKYKLITVRYGKGIAGRVISTGRPITIHDFPNNIMGKVLEYPIMLAEKLQYSFAVPVQYKGVAKGVLLVGQREIKPLSETERKAVHEVAQTIEKLIS